LETSDPTDCRRTHVARPESTAAFADWVGEIDNGTPHFKPNVAPALNVDDAALNVDDAALNVDDAALNVDDAALNVDDTALNVDNARPQRRRSLTLHPSPFPIARALAIDPLASP